jgi:hypothetical protein
MRPVTKPKASIFAAGVSAALALLASLTSAPAAAQSKLDPSVTYNYGENETPRSAAMGGALRAMGTGTSGLLLNPAALPAARVYHVEAIAQVTPETDRQVYGGAVVDSVTSRLAGAFSFMGGWADRAGLDRTFLDMRLALAYPITDRLMVGITGRYLKLSQSGLGPLGLSAVSGGLPDLPATAPSLQGRVAMINNLTLDLGLVAKPTDNIYIAAVGQNLTYPKNGLMPTIVGGGLGYAGEAFSIEADGVADLNSWDKPTARVGGGAEYVIAGAVPIRGGYRYDQGAKLSTVSLGTGYIGSFFSIEATVKRTLSNPGATSMIFSVAYFLESSGLTHSAASVTETSQ